MTAEIKINKIKILNDGTAEISYKSKTDLGTENISYTGTEKVTEEFLKAFQKSVNGFVSCLTVLEKHRHKITMNALQFYYDETEKLSHVIYIVKYAYSDEGHYLVNISTPKLPIYRAEFAQNVFSISGGNEENLYNILDAARAYLNGDTRTKQMKLEVVS